MAASCLESATGLVAPVRRHLVEVERQQRPAAQRRLPRRGPAEVTAVDFTVRPSAVPPRSAPGRTRWRTAPASARSYPRSSAACRTTDRLVAASGAASVSSVKSSTGMPTGVRPCASTIRNQIEVGHRPPSEVVRCSGVRLMIMNASRRDRRLRDGAERLRPGGRLRHLGAGPPRRPGDQLLEPGRRRSVRRAGQRLRRRRSRPPERVVSESWPRGC